MNLLINSSVLSYFIEYKSEITYSHTKIIKQLLHKQNLWELFNITVVCSKYSTFHIGNKDITLKLMSFTHDWHWPSDKFKPLPIWFNYGNRFSLTKYLN